MSNKNRNQRDDNSHSEQPEGWFDPETYRQNRGSSGTDNNRNEQHRDQNRNDQNRSKYQQTTNPNLSNRYDDINRRRMQTEYPDQNSFNRQYGNTGMNRNQSGNNSNRYSDDQQRYSGSNYDMNRNTNNRSGMYGDNFETPARLRNDGTYRSGNDNYNRQNSDRYSSGNDSRFDNDSNDRDWWDKASDEVASWFGNDEAERRRRMDKINGPHKGKGPKGYTRTDDRLREEINEVLYHDSFIDASDVEVKVENGEAVVSGTVDSRESKRRIEDIIESIPGVKDVENKLKVSHTSTPSSGEFGSNRTNYNDSSSWNR